MADRFSRGRRDRDRALQLVACHGARARRAADPACQSRGPPRRPGAAPPRGRESRRAGAARPAARAPPAVGLRAHPPAPPPGDPAKDAPRIARQLRLPTAELQRALRRRYAYFAGPYGALDVQPLRAVRGVHLEPVLNRFYPASDLARPVIGRVGDDGRGASGLERALDSLLAGRPGSAVVLKDRAGREYESPARVIAQPVAGADVALTLDAELQEIAQRALDDAIRRMDADGGDVVMMDPATGEVLAVASRRRDGSARPSAFTDTFEPGSVAKIFTAAALLALQRVAPAERVSGEDGKYRLGGRTITDEEPLPVLTLADAIRFSSNIALVKFAARLAPAEQYAMLRDFGFGAFTGIEFPAEATGRLRPPAEWSGLSAGSLAMGYGG